MEEQKQINDLIEEMKTKPFRGSYQVRQVIEKVDTQDDFYRKNDLLKVLWERYDTLIDKDFNDIFSSFKK